MVKGVSKRVAFALIMFAVGLAFTPLTPFFFALIGFMDGDD